MAKKRHFSPWQFNALLVYPCSAFTRILSLLPCCFLLTYVWIPGCLSSQLYVLLLGKVCSFLLLPDNFLSLSLQQGKPSICMTSFLEYNIICIDCEQTRGKDAVFHICKVSNPRSQKNCNAPF